MVVIVSIDEVPKKIVQMGYIGYLAKPFDLGDSTERLGLILESTPAKSD